MHGSTIRSVHKFFIFIGLIILGGEDGTHPKMVRLFKNRPNMSFSDAEGPADQEFNLGNKFIIN